MSRADQQLERLRASLDGVAAADLPELLAEARADARSRVRSLLTDALEHALLEQARVQLGERARTAAPAASRAVGGAPAWYVYGIVPKSAASFVHGLSGLGGQDVIAVSEGDLAAVVSKVPREEFEESQLRASLSDMTWVETVAREHEVVLDELCRRTTVIPMRMCTVYQSGDRVEEMLAREADGLHDALERLEGKREWGVQAFFSPARARPTEDPGVGDEPDDGSTGAAYIRRRQDERELETQLDQLVEQAAQEIHDGLSAAAFESMINPPQRPEASGRLEEMVLNGVYLVEDDEQPVFEASVRDLHARFSSIGLDLVITGPWPPYNFLPGSIGAAW